MAKRRPANRANACGEAARDLSRLGCHIRSLRPSCGLQRLAAGLVATADQRACCTPSHSKPFHPHPDRRVHLPEHGAERDHNRQPAEQRPGLRHQGGVGGRSVLLPGAALELSSETGTTGMWFVYHHARVLDGVGPSAGYGTKCPRLGNFKAIPIPRSCRMFRGTVFTTRTPSSTLAWQQDAKRFSNRMQATFRCIIQRNPPIPLWVCLP